MKRFEALGHVPESNLPLIVYDVLVVDKSARVLPRTALLRLSDGHLDAFELIATQDLTSVDPLLRGVASLTPTKDRVLVLGLDLLGRVPVRVSHLNFLAKLYLAEQEKAVDASGLVTVID